MLLSTMTALHFLYLRVTQCEHVLLSPAIRNLIEELFLSLSNVALIYSSTGTELGKTEYVTFRQPKAIPG